MRDAARIGMAAVLLCSSLCAVAADEGFPNRPIRLIVGFVPGGGEDSIARIVAPEIGKALGQPVVVENKPGAGATIGATYVAQQKPDGYTLGIAQANMYGAVKYAVPNLKLDGSKDLAPIGSLARGTLVVVAHKNLPLSNLKDVAAFAKASGKKVFYAAAGRGGITEYAGLRFQQVTGAPLEAVPFKGGAEALVSVVSGDTQLAFATAPSVATLVKAGQLKALGVTSAQRFAQLPDLPGAAEAGIPGYDVDYWMGVFGPAGLPEEVRQKIFAAIDKALHTESVRAAIAQQGMEAFPAKSVQAFDKLYRDDGKLMEQVRAPGQAQQ